eukprot:SM013453S27073  [mRNA]  locus=s13453:28:377:+ [translate_table: standard]
MPAPGSASELCLHQALRDPGGAAGATLPLHDPSLQQVLATDRAVVISLLSPVAAALAARLPGSGAAAAVRVLLEPS